MPQLIYKYGDVRAIDVIDRLRLKVTPPNHFNDPFEFTPQMAPDLLYKTAFRHVLDEEGMQEIYPEMIKNGQFSGSLAAFREEIQRRTPTLTKALIETYPQTAEDFRRRFINMISETFGVICLSNICDDVLMWGHYANCHTGMVIGFASGHDFWRRPQLQQVEYTTKRAMFDPNIELDDPQYRAQTRAIVRCKSSHWAYEQEWRQLRLLAECVAESGNDNLKYYVPIPADLISRVILGFRFSSERRVQLESILSQPEFDHVELHEACLHEREFRLVISRLR